MRTRFAPSPTGFLHVGGLRTALYSYLLAKQTEGKFLLRIEDTDQERSVQGAIENILRTLHWAGLDPEEGVVMLEGKVGQRGGKGPYLQSERLPLYQEHAGKLIENGNAYRCFCTTARLDEMRKAQEARKQAPMYDRRCLHLPPEEMEALMAKKTPHVIRMKVPHERQIRFTDDIRGEVVFQGHTIDDQVLLKSDGFPTYHLAHVVDDHFMDIDLVLRGEEWLSSLPKHLLLFEFLGWNAPRYAHVPLLLNTDKTKLSKRQNSVAAEEYIQKGYLPEALLNFLALLGWNPGTTQELFTMQELIDQFSLERVQKAGAVFDTGKLEWLQGQWMRKIPLPDFADRAKTFVAAVFPEAKHDLAFEKKAALIQERITFFSEAPDMLRFLYEEPNVTKELLISEKQKVTAEALPTILTALIDALEPIPDKDWSVGTMQAKIETMLTRTDFKRGQMLWPLRVALTGMPYSPGAYEVAEAVGRERTLKRLKQVKV